jgi:plasmid stabilization system protein ParE
VRLELSPRVEDDLTDIGEYIALHNSIRAKRFVDELITEIERIGEYSFSYRLRPDIWKRSESCGSQKLPHPLSDHRRSRTR